MKLFTFSDKVNDLLRRSLSLKREIPTTPTQIDKAGVDLADAGGDDFTYGEVDTRGKQPQEDVVTVPQGNGEVSIFYNAATREARPIPVNIKD